MSEWIYRALGASNHHPERREKNDYYATDPLDEYADEFKRLLDAGASFYKVQMVTGVNRARVSAYVQRKGWRVLNCWIERNAEVE